MNGGTVSEFQWDDGDGEQEEDAIPMASLEALEEGYGDDADGPDYDGYTAQERELLELGGVLGLSMELGDQAISDYVESLNGDVPELPDDFFDE